MHQPPSCTLAFRRLLLLLLCALPLSSAAAIFNEAAWYADSLGMPNPHPPPTTCLEFFTNCRYLNDWVGKNLTFTPILAPIFSNPLLLSSVCVLTSAPCSSSPQPAKKRKVAITEFCWPVATLKMRDLKQDPSFCCEKKIYDDPLAWMWPEVSPEMRVKLECS
ncbi:MAG: hypothetical protein M1829_005401 [Trizodia sp. TS-e1964]|nr:MAG: hypothetical protein M1829_005401 [Trizodia sp. TS-e1964]